MAKRVFLRKKELNLINQYVNLLKQKGVDVSKVILFGSYAKGTAKPESDIDIAIVSSQFGKNNLKEMMFLRRIALKIDSHLELLSFSPKDINDRYSALAQEIIIRNNDLAGVVNAICNRISF